ncbi:hypothetical protein [Flavobacterium branchiophilum]|uniref:hypothetical protein n=1 Tax=Flavobacterium branchiophilum TaxID=55197 RepID=UPI0016812E0C|nr:hypothetical protein [Flavobacterium branchiophilum]
MVHRLESNLKIERLELLFIKLQNCHAIPILDKKNANRVAVFLDRIKMRNTRNSQRF